MVLFARAPVPGRAKTRLIPALGPEGAAEIYRCFLLDTLEALRGLPADVIVAAAAQDEVEALSAAVREAACPAALAVQRGDTLGDRVGNALGDALSQGYSAAIAIGTDAPDLPVAYIGRAIELVGANDLVLGPCLDGGYYLVGMQKLHPPLFQGIEWSSAGVLSGTLKRASQMGLAVALLDRWEDVDTLPDLERLRERLSRTASAGGPVPCPRTWRRLQHLPERPTE